MTHNKTNKNNTMAKHNVDEKTSEFSTIIKQNIY